MKYQNPKQRAEYLVGKYERFFSKGEAIECAFITAEETYKELFNQGVRTRIAQEYWRDVIRELKNYNQCSCEEEIPVYRMGDKEVCYQCQLEVK